MIDLPKGRKGVQLNARNGHREPTNDAQNPILGNFSVELPSRADAGCDGNGARLLWNDISPNDY